MHQTDKKLILSGKIASLDEARDIIRTRLYEANRPPSFFRSVFVTILGFIIGMSSVFVFGGAEFFLFGFLLEFGVYGLWSSLLIKRYKEDLRKVDEKILKIRSEMK